MLSRRNVVAAGRIHHGDAVRRGRADVDVVDADARAADGSELGRRLDDVRRDLRGAADDEGRHASDRPAELFRGEPGPVVDFDSARALEDLEPLLSE